MIHKLHRLTPLFLIFLIIYSVSIIPAFSQESQIIDVVNTFYDSVEQGDKASLLSTIDPSIVSKIKNDPSSAGDLGKIFNFTEAVEKKKVKIKFKNRSADVKIVRQNSASVKVNLTFVVEIVNRKKVRESLSEDTFIFTQIRNRWLISRIIFSKVGE